VLDRVAVVDDQTRQALVGGALAAGHQLTAVVVASGTPGPVSVVLVVDPLVVAPRSDWSRIEVRHREEAAQLPAGRAGLRVMAACSTASRCSLAAWNLVTHIVGLGCRPRWPIRRWRLRWCSGRCFLGRCCLDERLIRRDQLLSVPHWPMYWGPMSGAGRCTGAGGTGVEAGR